MNEKLPKNGVKSVQNTYQILAALRESNGLTVTGLADRLELTPGAIHNHLATLRALNMVQKREDTYALGPECLLFGAHVRNHTPILRAAKSQIDAAAMETGEIGHVYIEEEGQLFIVHEVFGENAIGRTYHIERRETAHSWLHCTAGGKAILAAMEPERAREIVRERHLESQTENTVTDPDELLAELEVIRERGYASNDEEHITGIRAVGAAVQRDDGKVAGSISISGPTSRLAGEFFEEELPRKVTQAANISEVNLQTGDTGF